nr:putative serpin-Z8 [Aegilops tauschii subsp. strangulata]
MTGGFQAGSSSKKPRPPGSGLAELAARLTKRLTGASPCINLVFSPLSIYAAVALLAPSARGKTLDEILRLIGARSRDELEDHISHVAEDALEDLSDYGGPRVASACGVWNDMARPLRTAYHETVVSKYKAESHALDFRGNAGKAAKEINAWVARVTKGVFGCPH